MTKAEFESRIVAELLPIADRCGFVLADLILAYAGFGLAFNYNGVLKKFLG